MITIKGIGLGLLLFAMIAGVMFAVYFLTRFAPWWPFVLILAVCLWAGVGTMRDEAKKK